MPGMRVDALTLTVINKRVAVAAQSVQVAICEHTEEVRPELN